MFDLYFRRSFHFVLLCAVALSLSACGARWPKWAVIDTDPFGFLTSEDKSLAPEPPNMMKNGEKAPKAAAAPVETVDAGQPLKSMGLNLQTYFDPSEKDVYARLDRLERAIVAMHEDLKRMGGGAAVQTAAPTPVSSPAPHQYQEAPVPHDAPAHDAPIALNSLSNLHHASAPPEAPPSIGQRNPVNKGSRPDHNSNNSAVVTGVRVGKHSDKVRVVFDVTKDTNFTVDLDNGENILVVEMPNALWKMPVNQESFGRMPIVKSYKVDSFNNGQGNIFVLQLKQPTKILLQQKFPALSGGGKRVVIDLKR